MSVVSVLRWSGYSSSSLFLRPVRESEFSLWNKKKKLFLRRMEKRTEIERKEFDVCRESD